MANGSGPRSGKNAPKTPRHPPKRGKPKMSAEKWAKLSRKEKEIDYNGSRFSQVGNTGAKIEGAGANPYDKAPTHSRSNISTRGRATLGKMGKSRAQGRGGVGPNKR